MAHHKHPSGKLRHKRWHFHGLLNPKKIINVRSKLLQLTGTHGVKQKGRGTRGEGRVTTGLKAPASDTDALCVGAECVGGKLPPDTLLTRSCLSTQLFFNLFAPFLRGLYLFFLTPRPSPLVPHPFFANAPVAVPVIMEDVESLEDLVTAVSNLARREQAWVESLVEVAFKRVDRR